MQKIVLMTGASSGIGFATTKQLLEEGYIVYASSRKEKTIKEIKGLGGIPLRIEMTDERTMIEAVDRIIAEQGRIDVLFNNAGSGHFGPIEEIPLDVGRKILETNLFGYARLTQLVLPYMRAQKSGTIINTSSGLVEKFTPLWGGGITHLNMPSKDGLIVYALK